MKELWETFRRISGKNLTRIFENNIGITERNLGRNSENNWDIFWKPSWEEIVEKFREKSVDL